MSNNQFLNRLIEKSRSCRPMGITVNFNSRNVCGYFPNSTYTDICPVISHTEICPNISQPERIAFYPTISNSEGIEYLNSEKIEYLNNDITFPKEYPDEPSNYKGDDTCIICEDRKAIIVAIPCGHLKICNTCCLKSKSNICIICRVNVSLYNRVFV